MSRILRLGSILLCLIVGVIAAVLLAQRTESANALPLLTPSVFAATPRPDIVAPEKAIAMKVIPVVQSTSDGRPPMEERSEPELPDHTSFAGQSPAAEEPKTAHWPQSRRLRPEPPITQQLDDPKNLLDSKSGSPPSEIRRTLSDMLSEPVSVVDRSTLTYKQVTPEALPEPRVNPPTVTPAASTPTTSPVIPSDALVAALPPATSGAQSPIIPPFPTNNTPTAPALPPIVWPASPPRAEAMALSSTATTTNAPLSSSAASGKTATRVTNEGDNRLSLHLVDSDLREVLQLLSRGSGLAILPSDAVQGTVTASLPNVDFDTALNSILRAKGLVSKRDGNVIFVGTTEDFKKRELTSGKVITRLFRPNYVRAADLQKLFTPMLTPQIGTITVTSPAQTGIGSDTAVDGGDEYANSDVVLVRDYDSIILQIEKVFHQVDVKPLQVALEAMILSVKLHDQMDMGVNFAALRDNKHVQIVSGTPLPSLGDLASGSGLKVGFLDSSLAVFINALETIGDTNVIATPRVLALNKMRAEILIGSQLGYVSTTVTQTSTTQAVQFLEVGTQLRIRPFISSDGMIRMELHPELSTGSVSVQQGFTLPDKEVTGVTTNVMARDGSTVIIGGLIREDIGHTATQIPLLGSLPAVGALFRQKTEKIDKQEIIVLITPRIVCDADMKTEGNRIATEFHHREAVQLEKFSPFSKTHLCEKYIFLAQQAWAAGNQARAMRLINLAIHFDPENRSAIDLRADIVDGVHFGDHTGHGPFIPPTGTEPLDSGELDPWILNELEHPATKPLPHQASASGAARELPGS